MACPILLNRHRLDAGDISYTRTYYHGNESSGAGRSLTYSPFASSAAGNVLSKPERSPCAGE